MQSKSVQTSILTLFKRRISFFRTLGCACLLFSVSTEASAILTAKCPDSIEIGIADFRKLAPGSIEPAFWRYVNEVDPGMARAYEYLPHMAPIHGQLALLKKLHGRCLYGREETIPNGSQRIYVELKGTDREPHLQIFYAQFNAYRQQVLDYVLYVDLAYYSRTGIAPQNQRYAPLYTHIFECHYNQCRPNSIRLGYSTSVFAR